MPTVPTSPAAQVRLREVAEREAEATGRALELWSASHDGGDSFEAVLADEMAPLRVESGAATPCHGRAIALPGVSGGARLASATPRSALAAHGGR